MATKLDRILEWVESLLEKKAGVSDVTVQQSVDQPQQESVSDTNIDSDSNSESIDNQTSIDNVSDNVETSNQQSDQAQQTEQQQDPYSSQEDFDKEYDELLKAFWWDPTKQEESQQETVQQPNVAIEQQENSNQNFKELYEQELQKRLDYEWEQQNLLWQVNYLKSSLEKEGNKYWELMDKNKELEKELRTVNSRSIPEQFVPLSQTYNLWQETKIPAHKWRAVKEALTIVENMTWVPASGYYDQIIQAETHDIPEVNDKSSTVNKIDNGNKNGSQGFILL